MKEGKEKESKRKVRRVEEVQNRCARYAKVLRTGVTEKGKGED